MINKKNIDLSRSYQISYETKDRGGVTNNSVMDYRKLNCEVSFFQPTEGNNRINILPYAIKTANHPRVKSGDFKIGQYDYLLDMFIHRNVGATNSSVICLRSTYGKPCPICEQSRIFMKEGKKEEAQALRPSRRVYYNVQDLREPDKVKIFEVSHYLFEKELIDEARNKKENGCIEFANLENGKVIKFRATKVKNGSKEYLEYKSFDFENRENDIDDDLLDGVISLDECMNILTYEEVEKLFYGSSEEEEEEVEEVEEDYSDLVIGKKIDDEEKVEKVEDRNMCKYGHTFAKDCDKFDECEECGVWDNCLKARKNDN